MTDKLFLVLSIFLMVMGIVCLIMSEYVAETKVVKCYDLKHNEIIGDKCLEKMNKSFIVVGLALFVFGVIIGIVSFNNVQDENNSLERFTKDD